jgi:hypothetical protein
VSTPWGVTEPCAAKPKEQVVMAAIKTLRLNVRLIITVYPLSMKFVCDLINGD